MAVTLDPYRSAMPTTMGTTSSGERQMNNHPKDLPMSVEDADQHLNRGAEPGADVTSTNAPSSAANVSAAPNVFRTDKLAVYYGHTRLFATSTCRSARTRSPPSSGRPGAARARCCVASTA